MVGGPASYVPERAISKPWFRTGDPTRSASISVGVPDQGDMRPSAIRSFSAIQIDRRGFQ